MMNITRNRKIAISAVIMIVFMLATMPLAYAASDPSNTLPLNPANWVGIAFLGVMLIIVIAALVYMLSGLAGSFNARSWALGQVYDALISIVLLLIFAAFAYLFFLSPQGAFQSLNLVPGPCTGATTLYSLSECDIGIFSGNANTLVQTLFLVSFFAGVSPGITIKVAVPGFQSTALGVGFGIDDILPTSEEQLLSVAFSASFFMLMLNQLQVILIAGSLLFLAFFVTVGLVARSFGITRTFGGAMIAFGLGLGLVYPLLVAITYGYINVQIAALGGLNVVQMVGNLLQSLITILIASISGQFGSGLGALIIFNPQFIQQVGFIIGGLTFIPFLNFIILDAFIRDFSKSIGEEINFLQMLTGLA